MPVSGELARYLRRADYNIGIAALSPRGDFFGRLPDLRYVRGMEHVVKETKLEEVLFDENFKNFLRRDVDLTSAERSLVGKALEAAASVRLDDRDIFLTVEDIRGMSNTELTLLKGVTPKRASVLRGLFGAG